MLTNYKLFKLLSQMITLEELLLRKKFFSALMMAMTTLNMWFSVLFTDEAFFHVFRKVNKHNVQIWGSQNPYKVVKNEKDSPKVNVW